MHTNSIVLDFLKLHKTMTIVSRQSGLTYDVLDLTDGFKAVIADDEGLRKTVIPCLEESCTCGNEFYLSEPTKNLRNLIRKARAHNIDLKLIDAVRGDLLEYQTVKNPADHFKIGDYVTYRSEAHVPLDTANDEVIFLVNVSLVKDALPYLVGYTTQQGCIIPVEVEPWRVRVIDKLELNAIVKIILDLGLASAPTEE